MKKIVFVLVSVLVSFTANAQEMFNFGVKGGVNFANVTGEDIDGDMRTSFHLGVLAEIGLGEKFSFQPEVLYSSQGVKDGDGSIKLDYIQVPLMAKFYVSEGFSLEAGPQVGFLTSAEADFEGLSVDIKEVFSAVDFGLNLGAGYKLTNGIFLQGRYNLGLANIVDANDEDFELDGDAKAKNSVIQLSVGYMF